MFEVLQRVIKQFPILYRSGVFLKIETLRRLHRPLQALGIHYVPPTNIFAEIRRVRPDKPLPHPTKGPRVLFYVRGLADQALWDVTLAYALQLRGAQCDFVACDGILSMCEMKLITDTSPALCDACKRLAHKAPQMLGFPVHSLSSFVSAEQRAALRRHITMEEAQRLAERRVSNQPLGDIIGASLARFTLTGNAVSDDPAIVAARRGFLASADFMADACQSILDRLHPDRVLLLNGLAMTEQIMMGLAAARGIPVLTYEQGNKIRNTLIFAWNCPANRENLAEPWQHYRDILLTQTEEERLDEYVLQRAKGSVGSEPLWPKMQADQQIIRDQLKLDARPIISVFTNILWDTTMYQTQVAFSSMFDWLTTTLKLLSQRPELQVVVRIHPAEVRLKKLRSRDRALDHLHSVFPSLPEHIHLIAPEEDLSSYTLISMSRAVTVYNTTIGLEAVLRGVPVALSARCHFRGKGFTTDIETPDQYRNWLMSLPNIPSLTDEQQSWTRRYAYLYFFRFMIPFPFVDTHAYAPRLTYRSLDELLPGQDIHLDHICGNILNIRPLVL